MLRCSRVILGCVAHQDDNDQRTSDDGVPTPGDAPGAPREVPQGEERLYPVRRRPDLVRFLMTGAILGFAVGGLIAVLGPDAANRSPLQEVILLGLVGVLFFGLLAAVAYLVADRRSARGDEG